MIKDAVRVRDESRGVREAGVREAGVRERTDTKPSGGDLGEEPKGCTFNTTLVSYGTLLSDPGLAIGLGAQFHGVAQKIKMVRAK